MGDSTATAWQRHHRRSHRAGSSAGVMGASQNVGCDFLHDGKQQHFPKGSCMVWLAGDVGLFGGLGSACASREPIPSSSRRMDSMWMRAGCFPQLWRHLRKGGGGSTMQPLGFPAGQDLSCCPMPEQKPSPKGPE